MSKFSKQKINTLFKEFFEMLGESSDEDIETLLNATKIHAAEDLVGLLTESEEIKTNIKSEKIPLEEALDLVRKDIPEPQQDDVFIAAIQRSFELVLKLRGKEIEIPKDKLEEIEYFIAGIDKRELMEGTVAPKIEPSAAKPKDQVTQEITPKTKEVEVTPTGSSESNTTPADSANKQEALTPKAADTEGNTSEVDPTPAVAMLPTEGSETVPQTEAIPAPVPILENEPSPASETQIEEPPKTKAIQSSQLTQQTSENQPTVKSPMPEQNKAQPQASPFSDPASIQTETTI